MRCLNSDTVLRKYFCYSPTSVVIILSPISWFSKISLQWAGIVQSVQRLGYGLHDRMIGSIPGGGWQFFSGAHPASDPMGTRGSFLRCKAAGAWSWPLTSTAEVTERVVPYESVSKSFRTGRLEWELQMVHISATRCNFIAILWVSLVSFAAITLCVASQRVFVVVSLYFVINPVRKLLDTPSCTHSPHTPLWRGA
jgi:hypothetical protein